MPRRGRDDKVFVYAADGGPGAGDAALLVVGTSDFHKSNFPILNCSSRSSVRYIPSNFQTHFCSNDARCCTTRDGHQVIFPSIKVEISNLELLESRFSTLHAFIPDDTLAD